MGQVKAMWTTLLLLSGLYNNYITYSYTIEDVHYVWFTKM